MSVEASAKPTVRQKIEHEFVEFAGIALYLAFFFCSLSIYSILLLNEFDVSTSAFAVGTALINALIVAKVILIGEYARLGKRHENKAILLSALYKSILFSVLVLAFHFVEEAVKIAIHRQGFAGALHEVRIDLLLARSLVVFCTFLPLFAFRELQRVMGEEKFRALFFKTGADRTV